VRQDKVGRATDQACIPFHVHTTASDENASTHTGREREAEVLYVLNVCLILNDSRILPLFVLWRFLVVYLTTLPHALTFLHTFFVRFVRLSRRHGTANKTTMPSDFSNGAMVLYPSVTGSVGDVSSQVGPRRRLTMRAR